MPARHRPTAASKARRTKGDDDNIGGEDSLADAPSSKEKLKYFQAKRNRWNAARLQFLHRPPIVVPDASSSSPHEATKSVQQQRVSSRYGSYRQPDGDHGDKLTKQPFKGLPSLSWSSDSANDAAASISLASTAGPATGARNRSTKEGVDIRPSGNQEREMSSSNAGVAADAKAANGNDDDGSATLSSYRDQVIQFYAKHNPSKVDSVNSLLERYAGREDHLLQKLKDKYEIGGGGVVAGSVSSPKKAFPLPPSAGSVRCFLKFSSHPSQRVVVELFDEQVPATVENFRQLCLRPSAPLGYTQSVVHRIVPNFCVQLGDYTNGDGTGGRSIYTKGSNDVAAQRGLSVDLWGNFQDEAFLQHSEAGLLSMANNGPHKNSSQFFVTLKPLPHLDGKHVVFGRVLEGFDTVIQPMAQNTVTDAKQRPLVETIRIVDCGQIVDGREVWTEEELVQLSSKSNDGGGVAIPPATDMGMSFGGAASELTSPFGAAFGFGTATTPPPLSASSAASTPFSFAALSATAAAAAPASFSFAALSAAATSVVNTSSCDAFSSFRGVTDDAFSSSHVIVEETTQATAASASFDEATSRTADEQDATSNAIGDYLQRPVSSFAVRSDPPNRGSTTTATTATASAAQLWSTPSVPFSFSPSSTITTVDPFSFASSRSTSTVAVGTRAAAAARANAGERRAYIESEDGDSEEEDDDEYVPEDDEESYSDETPSTCSEASDDDDDDDDDAFTADSFRMQAPTTTTSTFSDVVPPPHPGAVSGAASSPSSTFSFTPPTAFGGAAPSSAATSTNRSGFPTANVEGAAPSQAASPLAAVEVNHSQPKSPTTLFGTAAPSSPKSAGSSASEPVSDRTLMGACDFNETAKTTPFSRGFGFGSGGVGFGFGSSTGATLSFAGIAATGETPAFGTPTMFPSENPSSVKASFFQTPAPPTSSGKSAAGLSFTELRQTSNDARGKDIGLYEDDHDDDDDDDGSSRTPTSSRSESPVEGSLERDDWEPVVSGLLSRGCLSTASESITIGGVPKDKGESIDKDLPVSKTGFDEDADRVATTLALSGLDSNDDLTSPAELASFGGALVELASSSADCELNDYTAEGANVDCEPPNVYSISFSTYDSATFVVPSFSQEEKPSVRKERQSETRTEDLLDCSSEINDVPTTKVNETFESEVNDPHEPAKLSPDDPTCGLCWCLKSDSIETVHPAVPGASDNEPTVHVPPVDLAPKIDEESPTVNNVPLASEANGDDVSKSEDDALPVATSQVFRPTASPRSPGVGDPTMSTESEKDYVPESLRRLVKEASLAIREGQKSFLTSVKEDLSLVDNMPQGQMVCADMNDHPPSNAGLPEEVLFQRAATSTASSMLYLLPFLLVSEAPSEQSRSLAIRTPRFQVLGGDSLAKKVTFEAKTAAVPVRLPFVPLSAPPPPFDAASELTYTALLLQLCGASRSSLPPSIMKHEPINETTGGDAANAPLESPQRSIEARRESSSKSTEESRPYFFGSSGPAASAFYFGHSASPLAVPSSGSWYTAGTSSPPRQSTSASSPGLVGASCSSSRTATIGANSAPAAASTTANGEGGNAAGAAAFVFGEGIKPVVFNFEDREAREATYARYLGGGRGGEVALSAEETSRQGDTNDTK